MITRVYAFKFFNPNVENYITEYGLMSLEFSEDLDIKNDEDVNNILEKFSENIKNIIREKYEKDNGYNTKKESFWGKDKEIKLFDFKRRRWSPFKDDNHVYSIVHKIHINKSFLGYSNTLEVE